jgi:hypothetical protein
VDGHDLIVLIKDLGRDLAGDDAFKQRHRLGRKDSVATGPREKTRGLRALHARSVVSECSHGNAGLFFGGFSRMIFDRATDGFLACSESKNSNL